MRGRRGGGERYRATIVSLECVVSVIMMECLLYRG